MLNRRAGAALGEGFGDWFAAFWAGEGVVEVFEDVAAGFAEEGVLVLPFVFWGCFWHWGSVGRHCLPKTVKQWHPEEDEEKKDPLRRYATPPPEARGRRKITGGTPVPRGGILWGGWGRLGA